MKLSKWLVISVLSGISLHLVAQDPTMEQLERRLDAAKKAEASKQAAAQKKVEAARRADKERRRQAAAEAAANADAARRAESAQQAALLKKADTARRAESSMGTLIVEADRDCALSINGESRGRLVAGHAITMKVHAGDQLIECSAGVRQQVQSTAHIPGGEQKVVRLLVPSGERFEKVAGGVRDNAQNVVWASHDNGTDIGWTQAGQYCQSLGSGWRLPTTAQLLSLYDPNSQYAQTVRYMVMFGVTIKPVTPLIRLTGIGYWSSEVNGSTQAFSVNLLNGYRGPYAVSVTTGARALCARRS